MNGDFKRIIDAIYVECDLLNDLYDLSGFTMKEVLKNDLLKFVLYIASSDEVISQEEADFISEYLDLKLTIPQLYNIINSKNYQKDSVLENVPVSLKIFVDADNKANDSDSSLMNICEKYIKAFKLIGELFIETNNNSNTREKIALGKYISMLCQYYDDNTKRTNSFDENNEKEKDNNIRIKLDDRTIVIPQALPETILRMQELVPLRNEMIKQAEKERDNYDPHDFNASPWCCYSKMYDLVEQYGEKYEREFKKEYRDYPVFAPSFDYMSKYYTVCKSAEEKLCRRYDSYNNMKSLGMRVAEEQAAKEIRGMQFGVITNSLTSALVYTGLSALTYASQAKKAQEVYDKNIKIYSGERPQVYEMQVMNEEIFPLIYPVAEKTTALFLRSVMEDIDQYKQIGYSRLSDKHKTQTLVDECNYIFGNTIALRNVVEKLQSVTNNKEMYSDLLDLLEECPYCPEIFIRIIKMEIFDKRVFEIAKIMHIEKTILPELEKYISKNKHKDVLPVIEIVAMYKSQSVEQIMKQQYRGELDSIKRNCTEIQMLLCDSRRLDRWIKDNINKDMDKVVVTSADTVKDKVASWLLGNLEGKLFAELSDMGLITIEDIRMKDSTKTTLEEVKAEYAAKLLSLIDDYIKEAGKRKNAYEEAYDKFDAEIKKRNDAISEKYEELKQQGMFAFSKKKEIKAEIEQLQNELENFRKTEPVDLKNAYFGMYDK